MTESDLFLALNDMDEALLEHSETSRIRRRAPWALIAAVLAVFLLGACAAVTLYGDSIQNWYAHFWQAETGRAMSGGQRAVLDGLSTEIGVSTGAGGVTVTVDSAAAGTDCFYALLRVEGADIPQAEPSSEAPLPGGWDTAIALPGSAAPAAGFLDVQLELDPALQTGLGSQLEYLGADADGAGLFLLRCSADGADMSRPVSVTLTLSSLAALPHPDEPEIIAQGPWKLTFGVAFTASEPVPFADAQLTADGDAESSVPEHFPVQLTDVRVTETGLAFTARSEWPWSAWSDVRAVLRDGTKVGCWSASAAPRENGTQTCRMLWSVPVDPADVDYLLFGAHDRVYAAQ